MFSKTFFLFLFASVVYSKTTSECRSSSSISSSISSSGGSTSVNIQNVNSQTNIQSTNTQKITNNGEDEESSESYSVCNIRSTGGSISIIVGDKENTFSDGKSKSGKFTCPGGRYSLEGNKYHVEEVEGVKCEHKSCLRFRGFVAQGDVEEYGLFGTCAGTVCGNGVAKVKIVKDGDARQGEVTCCTGKEECAEMEDKLREEMENINHFALPKEFEKAKAELAEERKKRGKKQKKKIGSSISQITAVLTVIVTILCK